MDKGRNLSIYFGNKTMPFLLSILAERQKFKSRSDLINFILKGLLKDSGLLNDNGSPTKAALRESKALRLFLEEERRKDREEKKEPQHSTAPIDKVRKALRGREKSQRPKPR